MHIVGHIRAQVASMESESHIWSMFKGHLSILLCSRSNNTMNTIFLESLFCLREVISVIILLELKLKLKLQTRLIISWSIRQDSTF